MREFLIDNIKALTKQIYADDLEQDKKIEKLVRLTTLQECLTAYLIEEIDGLGPLISILDN